MNASASVALTVLLAVAFVECVPAARLHREPEENAGSGGEDAAGASAGGGAGNGGAAAGSSSGQGGGAAAAGSGSNGGASGASAGSALGHGGSPDAGAAGEGEDGNGGSPSAGARSDDGRAGGHEPPVGGAGAGEGGTGATEPSLDGRWVGLTSQGRLLWLDVLGNTLAGIRFDWELDIPVNQAICHASGAIDTDRTGAVNPAVIDEMGRVSVGPVPANPATYSLTARFDPQGTAEGTLQLSYSGTMGCVGSAGLSWDADHVVCGDGRLSWPETCDPADPVRSANCNELCQLPVTSEVEPNDTIPPGVVVTVENDAIVSGALSDLDQDVFAIRNPLAGTIAVELELHAETVGTCRDADTFLEVLRVDGSTVAEDDDGSRSLYCSYLGTQMSAGETLYVRVSSWDLSALPRYNLHIKYQRS